MPRHKRFGERLRELREARRRENPRFSLRQFAQALGVSATYVSRLELSEITPPNAERITQIAALLEVDPQELLSLADRIDPEVTAAVRANPEGVGRLLRTARAVGATQEDYEELIRLLEAKLPPARKPGKS